MVAGKLDRLSAALLEGGEVRASEDSATSAVADAGSLAEQQLRRVERQVGVLERAAAAMNVR